MDIYELDSYRLSDAVKFHTELNPALWAGDRMRPEVRDALIKIADDFREFLGIDDLAIEDITVSGSNAAYTYTPHSDIDLHLIVDFSKLNPDQVYQELFNAKKYQYNDQHDIKIRGYDVELYVQDANKPVRSLGEYSITKDDWNRIPVRRRGNLDEKSTRAKYEKLQDLIELALNSDDLKTVTNLTDVIKKYRQAGLDEHGEFGPENLAYKILRTQGLVEKLFKHRASLEDSKLSLAERKKKKKKNKKKFRYGSFGGYYYPGYGYYGQSGEAEAADGGGDGGGESVREQTEIKVQAKSIPLEKVVRRFVNFAAQHLKLDKLPRIILQGEKFSRHIHSMGHYVDDKKMIEVATHGRHIMDILRTVAHELTHYRQHERLGKEMPDTAGRTGSPYENEANAQAGIIMRHFQNKYPEFFGAETVEEGIGKALATGALAAATALGQPAQAQDAGKISYQIGKQIYQPSGIFTRAGAQEELRGIARDMARGSREIRVGGKLIYGGAPTRGERVASNASANSPEEAYRQALENAITRAQQQYGNIQLGQDGWKVTDYEADQIGNTYRAMVAIEGPAPRREAIATPVNKDAKAHEDYYRFLKGKLANKRPLTRQEQEFLKTYHLKQQMGDKVAESLTEFAPPGSSDGDDGFSEETLKRLAAEWYRGDEDPAVERTLAAAGWEIGQDEGYDEEPGVFVVQSGDVNGNSYLSWSASELQHLTENASGYIPTKKQANDPRFKTALTVDIRPGQVGKEANKLGLQTDSQGRPALLIKNLANALKEYKETGDTVLLEGFSTGDVIDLTPNYSAFKTLHGEIQGTGTDGKLRIKIITAEPVTDKVAPGVILKVAPNYVRRSRVVNEDEELLEVKMSPSALESWARSPEAQGIRAGFEAEMIFRDTKREDEEEEQEPDYDYDERPDNIEHVVDFFSNDDYGYGLTSRGARELRNSLMDEYMEWVDEQISESWDSEAEDQVRDYMETNVWGDDEERERRIQDKIDELFPDDDAEAILAAGAGAPRFTRSSDQQEYLDQNELYRKYREAEDAAQEDFETEVVSEVESQGEYYDSAREYYTDMMRDSGDYDESDFLRDRYGYMSDIENSFSLDWPYWSGGSSSGYGTRDWSDIANSLERVTGMDVKVGSGYHSVSRKDDRYIIEPDGSLNPDDYEDAGLEIVSPPMPLPQALEQLQRVIEWGNNQADAYTNSSTGLHMGVSIPYVGGDVDYVKLVLFMGDEYILDKFGRASNTYAASAMGKLRQNIAGARNRGELTEAKFDPMGALELVQKNLIELAARYVQSGVGSSKYTSAHIKDGYIEFRSPGGDYLSMEGRGEFDDIRNTMLRFARAMYIAGHPAEERREYAKKLYKLISPGEQDDGLKLFAEYAAGTISPEQLKKQWADAVLRKEIPTTGKEEYEVFDMNKSKSPDGVIDTFYARDYDDANNIYTKKYSNDPRWRQLDIRKKYPWFDVKDSYGDIIFTVRARDIDSANEKVQAEYGDQLSDDWQVFRRPDGTPEPEKKLSRRAQIAKRIKEPKVTTAVAADNEKDSQQLQARIGEPVPAGGVADTGYYRVSWTERKRGEIVDDSLNVDAPNATAAMDRVRSALQAQGREAISIEANPQPQPAWRGTQQSAVSGSTQDLAQQRAQGGFTGAWRVVNRAGNEVYRFSGVGNNQNDANRTAQTWLISQGDELENQGPFEVLPVMG